MTRFRDCRSDRCVVRAGADAQIKLVVTSKNRQTDRYVGKIREFLDTVFEAISPAKVCATMKTTLA